MQNIIFSSGFDTWTTRTERGSCTIALRCEIGGTVSLLPRITFQVSFLIHFSVMTDQFEVSRIICIAGEDDAVRYRVQWKGACQNSFSVLPCVCCGLRDLCLPLAVREYFVCCELSEWLRIECFFFELAALCGASCAHGCSATPVDSVVTH